MSEPSNDTPVLRVAARSDTGVSRMVNQDYAYAGALPSADAWTLLAVADGVGGHAAGEWASQRAIELLASSLAEHLSGADPARAFETAIAAANEIVNAEARRQGSPGAATTLVAGLVSEGQFWWANVGDSRLYLVSEGRSAQVSADHSWVAEQVRQGLIPPEDARHHPRRNVVTRTVGFEARVLPDTGGPIPLSPGDAVVLCSDGLHGPVDEDDIARTVIALDPELAAERLIQMANEAGGPDNITVVIARFDVPAPVEQAPTVIERRPTAEAPAPRRSRRGPLWAALAVAAIAAVAATAAARFFDFGF